jgi:glycerophosphoryl diester phosphodiesterase
MFRRLGATTATALTSLATVTPAATAALISSPTSITPAEPSKITAAAPSRTVTALARSSTITTIAHRGASAYAPENTIAAFELAVDQRADMFELDVQETKDHKLVLMHDTTLTRTTNAKTVFPNRSPWRVHDFTLAQIRRLDAGSWKGAKYRGESVPTLGEALTKMDGTGIGILLEIKKPELYRGIEGRVVSELKRHPSWLAPRRLIVQSFNWSSMRTFHRKLGHIPIGLIGTPPSSELPRLRSFASQVNPPHSGLIPRYVRRVHSLGMKVLAWTVNDPKTMRRMISYGVDGIITNKPDVLARVIDS